MPDDYGDFFDWTPSLEGLDGLEDKDYELTVEEFVPTGAIEVSGPCGGCANCATGSIPIGADLENREASLDLVEVEFKNNRSLFFINQTGMTLVPGSCVVTEAERGCDLGEIVAGGELAHIKRRSRGLVGQPMRNALRLATPEDMKHLEENRQIEEKAASIFLERCRRHNLQMKLIGVEYQFDRTRITFYFTADGRVDFRLLVRDLAGVYRTRIELRQIGARDEARKIGGLGICGREICCVSWMRDMKRVTLDHARFQNLSLNPARLAGSCGRLKCCILFELENYLDALKRFPPLNSTVITPRGEGHIEKLDIYRDSIYLRYQGTGAGESVSLSEFKVYRNGSSQDRPLTR